MNLADRNKAIQKASFIGIIANSLLSAAKISVGIISGSLALLGDGIDSFFDIFTSLTGLISTRIADKPPDINHPFGHSRAETIAAKLMSFLLLIAGFQLIYNTLMRIIRGGGTLVPGHVMLLTAVISALVKLILWQYKKRLGKIYHSQILLADARNMMNDIILSLSVLIGLVITIMTGYIIFDRLLAIGVGLWIIKGALEIYFETSNELMDGTEDTGLYQKIFSLAETFHGIHNPHKARLRKMSYYYLLDLDIEVDPAMTVLKSHELATALEKKIREELPEIRDIMVHIEPSGCDRLNENFGVTPADLNN